MKLSIIIPVYNEEQTISESVERVRSVDLPGNERVSAKALARRLVDRLREHAQDLGAEDALEGIEDLIAHGNGASRQVVVYEANHDLREVMAEIVAATAP